MWFSVPELAELTGVTQQAFRKRYSKFLGSWTSRKREGREGGGGREYAYESLPKDIQGALLTAGRVTQCEAEAIAMGRPGGWQ